VRLRLVFPPTSRTLEPVSSPLALVFFQTPWPSDANICTGYVFAYVIPEGGGAQHTQISGQKGSL